MTTEITEIIHTRITPSLRRQVLLYAMDKKLTREAAITELLQVGLECQGYQVPPPR